MFEDLEKTHDVGRLPDFHLRFGDLLLNLASLRRERQNVDDARGLLSDAVGYYSNLGRRAVASGSPAAARDVLENLSRLMPELTERDRASFAAAYQDLQRELDRETSNRR